MKRLIFVIVFFFSLQLFAQERVSYEINNYYYEKEGIEIPSLQFEIIDKEYFKEIQDEISKENHNTGVYFRLTLDLDFFKLAKKIKVNKDTTIYFLHIRPIDMSYFRIGYFIDVPENILITELSTSGKSFRKSGYIRSYKTGEPFNDYLQYDVFSGEFILKIIQIGKVRHKFNMNIHHLDCFLANKEDPFDNKLSDIGIIDNECGNSVMCMPGIEDWTNQYKGVFRIKIDNIKYKDDPNRLHFAFATAFVLNTSDNYDMDKSSKPYVLTCHHFLEKVIENGYDIEDVLSSTDGSGIHTMVKFDYLRKTCDNDDKIHSHLWQYPEFVLLEKGDWTGVGDLEEDYLFMQFGSEDCGSINDIFYRFGVNSYPGWRNDLTTNYDYSELAPTYVFHHAKNGDYEMKYAKDNEYAVTDPTHKFVTLHIDEGFTTSGGSGSPIFAGDHSIIGMLLTGQNTCEEPQLQTTRGLAFSYLWDKANLEYYLGSKEKVYAMNTDWEGLPDHCDDCEYNFDLGETGLDCGGPCKPCKVFLGDDVDVNTFKSTDLPEMVQANNISMTGTEINPIMINEDIFIDANNSLTLNNDIVIDKGIELKTGRISIIVSREEDIICGFYHGEKMFWGQMFWVRVKNATKFRITVLYKDRVVHQNSGDIYYDGEIDVWDTSKGNNVNRQELTVVSFNLELWDTIGEKHEKKGHLALFPK